MDRFKVGDKVYNKKGNSGEELGTVAAIKENVIVVRQFSNNLKEDYDPNELYTKQEHETLDADWMAKVTPKYDPDKFRI